MKKSNKQHLHNSSSQTELNQHEKQCKELSQNEESTVEFTTLEWRVKKSTELQLHNPHSQPTLKPIWILKSEKSKIPKWKV